MPGFFAQDDLSSIRIPAIPPRFGLLDESPERWPKFFAKIKLLNETTDGFTSYKVLFLGRHGQGYHNVAEAKYGTQAWNDYWSKLNGDGEIVWGPDPLLTDIGEHQAIVARDAWNTEMSFKLQLPGKFYCSPLTRAMRTCQITFEEHLSPETGQTMIVKNCREESGVHTCDKRRTMSYIKNAFPTFQLELGFSEEDLLWNADVRETKGQVEERARKVLDMIFSTNDDTFVSITAHGGIINAFLAVVGRPTYPLPTGGILPIVVRSVHSP